MFCNHYSHFIDDKGRLIIPVEYRSELTGSEEEMRPFYVTRNLWDPEGKNWPCLCLWPEPDFLAMREKLHALSGREEKNRRMKLKFFSNTQCIELDKQGRILIAAELKNYAGLTHNVVLVGADEHLEIWDADIWQRYNQVEEEGDTEVWSDTLGSIGF